MEFAWVHDLTNIDWEELSELYRVAPLGEKPPERLKIVFANSRFMCFVYHQDMLIGAGRAISDGMDVSYIADIAVHPGYQGQGLGKQIVSKLVEFSKDHKKIILYANPGKEGFYKKLGFLRMNTAMAIFSDSRRAVDGGVLRED